MNQHDQEKIQDLKSLLSEVQNFTDQVEELHAQGKRISRKMQQFAGSVSQQGQQLDLYFNNRLKSFLEGNEMFKFGYASEALEGEIEEIKQDIIEDEEDEEED